MKISTATRDRLRALATGGASLEDVVVAALDVHETQQFWAAAESASAVETAHERVTRRAVEGDLDTWMDTIR